MTCESIHCWHWDGDYFCCECGETAEVAGYVAS